MCLFINTNQHKDLKPKIAKQDIFGYKVLLYSSSRKEFYTPYMNTPVDITAEFKCKRFQNTPQDAFVDFHMRPGSFLYCIDKAIHLYSTVGYAIDAAQSCISQIFNITGTYTFACVYRVAIPKGNKYWIGMFNSMCTKSISFKDIVAVFCNNIINTGRDLTFLQQECINLLKDGVNEDILRSFFYSIDVDKIIREYTEAELGILEPAY